MGEPNAEGSWPNPWPVEEEYLRYLRAERQLCAWCLIRLTGLPPDQAMTRAVQLFPYEPPDAPFRGIMFHAGAWDVAAQATFPEYPGRRGPEEFGVEKELDAEAYRLFHGEPRNEPIPPDYR